MKFFMGFLVGMLLATFLCTFLPKGLKDCEEIQKQNVYYEERLKVVYSVLGFKMIGNWVGQPLISVEKDTLKIIYIKKP